MEQKLLSIITVCFNAVENIEATLNSVVLKRMSFADEVEYIVIDGNSTDGTQEVIKKYETHIAHFVSERDSGIYDAMNKGIALAKGQFVYFINAGDELLTLPVLELKKEAGADLISFPVKQSNGLIFYPHNGPQLKYRNTLHHQGNFYKVSTTAKYDLVYRVFADFNLNQNIYKNKHKIVVKNTPVVAFHDLGGISHDKSSLLEIFKVVRSNYGLFYSLLSRIYFKKIGAGNKLDKLLRKN